LIFIFLRENCAFDLYVRLAHGSSFYLGSPSEVY